MYFKFDGCALFIPTIGLCYYHLSHILTGNTLLIKLANEYDEQSYFSKKAIVWCFEDIKLLISIIQKKLWILSHIIILL